MTQQGIGARLVRKEDDRYMRGRGQYVGDIRLPGMLEVAFLRSPLAHARIKAIQIPSTIRERVFIAEDLAGVSAIRADTTLPGFKSSLQPVLATAKVRYVGELVAMCIAPTRAEAEDLAGEIEPDLEPLPVVADMLEARKAGAPLGWIEDRRESLTANANCREHHYILTAYADADGRLLALDCEATVDSGAYSAYPFSACLEAGQVTSILPGLYDFPHYRCRAYSVATNKPPILPYRGVARTGVCFALEVTLDALARKLGRESNEIRLKSLVRPEQMPFDNIAKRHFDS